MSIKKVIFIILIFCTVFEAFLDRFIGLKYAGLVDDALMLVLSVLAVFWLLSNINSKQSIYVTYIFIFCVLITLSAIVNEVELDVYLVQSRSYMLPLLLMLSLTMIGGENLRPEWIINVLSTIMLILFFSAIAEYIIGKPLIYNENRFGDVITFESGFRAYSLIGNPIDFSNYILLNFIVFFAAREKDIISKKKGMLLLIICATCLLMSASRGPIIALILSALLYNIRGGGKIKKLIGPIALVIPAIYFIGDRLIGRFSQISIDYFLDDGYRTLFLMKSVEVLFDNPIFGVGPGKFGGWVSINYHQSPIYDLYQFDTDGISSIDMFWPHFIVEIGILGVIPLIFLFYHLYRSAKRTSKVKEKTLAFYSLIIQFMMPCLLLIGLFSISLETQIVTSFMALFCSFYIIEKKNRYLTENSVS